MSSWAAFWLFMCVFMVCDSWLYSKGHNTFFWKHQTEAELQIQKRAAGQCSCVTAQREGE